MSGAGVRSAALLACVAWLGACGGTSRPRTAGTPDERFEREAAAFYDAHLAFRPASGVELGLHRYDGVVPDRSPAALTAEIARLRAAEGTFTAIPADALTPQHRVEREVLLGEIRDQLFGLEVQRNPWRNPMYYGGSLDVAWYISRDYAPVQDRARAILSIARGATRYLAEARANLEARMPRTFIDTALLQLDGSIVFLRDDVPRAMKPLAEVDATLAAELDQGLHAMAEELGVFREFLLARRDQASDEFALGPENFLRMLRETQGLDIDLATLKKIAEADLERNLASMTEAARAVDPDPARSVAEIVLRAAQDRPNAGTILGIATEQAETARRFLIDRKIVSIPREDVAQVRETPPFMRWNSAFLDQSGVFESKPLPSFYYISPPDPKWPKEEQEAYLIPTADLLFTTVHELWPGHFLHGLHVKVNPSRILKSFCTYSMVEGWAHYVEEMMWDEGLGERDPRVHIGQLKEALLRNVRFMVAIGEHAEGMTVEQATTLFRDKAFADAANARQQAVRGTFDPMYLSYTIGKLMIRKLAADWKAKVGDQYSLQAFHDKFLEYGCAPIPVIRRAMLGDDAGPAL